MHIKWRKSENEFIERTKINATFVLDTAKDYWRARIVLSMDSWGAQQIAYVLERELHNIGVESYI